MGNLKGFDKDFNKLEGSLLNAEEKLGVNPLELWMNEIIEKKRNSKEEKTEE